MPNLVSRLNLLAYSRQLLALRLLSLLLLSALTSCKVAGAIFGTLLGYPGPVRASKYRYYDPHFARTQFLALHKSNLQTTGFYYDPVSAQQARVNRTLGTGSTLSYFLAFFPDGGFMYGGTSEYLPDLQRRLQTVDRSLYAGYYRVSRDTAYLEVVDRGSRKHHFFQVVIYADSVRAEPAEYPLGKKTFSYYHSD